MRLARLHRRLAVLMALAALAAFAAGAGATPPVLALALVLSLALGWRAEGRAGEWLERATWLVAVALFARVLHVAFITGGDVLPPALALLLVLAGAESLRPLSARNDLRLYSLSFALLIAATAYYPGIGFAAAFIAYLALATLGLMVGHLRRQAERFQIRELRVPRSFLSLTAALSVLTVLMSAGVFLLFPRLPRGWLGQGRTPGAQVMAGFSETVALGAHGSRIGDNPEVMLRVEFPGGAPAEVGGLHWRGRSYDRFDGRRWSRSPGYFEGDLPRHLYQARWGASLVAQRIYGGPPGARVLFGLPVIVGLRAGSAIRPLPDATGDITYQGWDAPVYTVLSAPPPPPAALRAVPAGITPGGGRYLQLPPLAPALHRLADSLVHGQPTRYDAARALERYFKQNFRYTLELPTTPAEATLEHFLLRRRAGHCEYFSSAMVVLLRAAGIPARNVNGFLGGEWNDFGRYLAVTGNDAHSWVEVWFPELGWVAFDPTPAASRERTLAAAEDSRLWPALFWFDGLQHRWYKWVVDYNLEKQLGLLRAAGDAFPGRAPRLPRGGGVAEVWLGWSAVLAAVLAGAWLLRRRRGHARRARPETRLYLALRRAYRSAGFGEAPAPLAWLAALRRAGAPGMEAAERVVRLYLRARFGAQPLDAAQRAEMRAALSLARRALRAAR